ncbi:MAG: POTRA domain-containing protein [Ferruginibacter sp.]
MTDLKKIFCCGLILFSSLFSHAQKSKTTNITLSGTSILPADSTRKVCVNSLLVIGTKRTKIYIVYREIQFKKGDSIIISQLQKELEQARNQVNNTTLFNEVKFDMIVLDTYNINITVTVTERWYLYPLPQFQLVDRNFNVWWKTYKRSFDRVNYGIKFTQYNLSGRRDQLNIYLINGYSRNISFSYSNPYSNSSLNRGFSVSAGYTQNREIAYKTSDSNTVEFYPSDEVRKQTNDFVRNGWYVNASYLIRNGFFTRQNFSAGYTFLKVDDTVLIKNHNYFKDSVTSKGYIDLAYTYQYTNVDNTSYSLKGTSVYISVLKRGLGFTGGLNMFSIEAGLNKYYSLGKNWYSNFQLSGRIKLPFDQAYINQRGLGYGDSYLRGLEYNVVDGVAYGLLRSTLKKKLISFTIPFPYFPKILTKIPFTFFAKTFTDLGYVYNKPKYDTYLNNRLLYTGGFGIDILTVYDVNLRFEYSFNQLNKSGLFFHTQSGF